jgi:glycerol-3-phosphate dehydrogenase (NAD(P)+)
VRLETTAILGTGSWGTALARLWANDTRKIWLWGNSPARVQEIQRSRENARYLPKRTLPDSVCLTTELADCASADLIIFVTPSTALRAIVGRLRQIAIRPDSILLTCTKGIEHGTGMRMSEIMHEKFPHNIISVLSGPNLAGDVSLDLPTASVLACAQSEQILELQAYLGTPRFRLYTSDDLIGVELGGALKNILAIAAGVCDGLALGDNSKAALCTRALAEMIRLGTAMGGQLATFYGLSGAGDLILTCYSKQSRNRRVGEELSRGRSLQEITAAMQTVAEGIPTTKSAYECARRLRIETPIIDQVHALLYEGRSPAEAMKELLSRDQKPERL